MTKLLIDESPLQVCPTLATYLGLNEAIFIQQLHYILTNNEKVGKTIDGRRWYRDKPGDFIIKYFPFWDEGILRRAIANLRKDNILLARSDLNEIPKDRSLWYSINYSAIDRLDGPVNRLQEKYRKRKEARQSRKDTKVQNVHLTGDRETPDQNGQVLQVKSTKCKSTKVQNVPIPKESLPKDSSFPNGNDGGNSPLLPDTSQSQLLFEKLKAEFNAKGRRAPKKFPSLACKRKFDARAKYLNSRTAPAIDRALEKGILSVTGIVDFIAKWEPKNGQVEHKNKKTTIDDEPYFDVQTGEYVHPGGERTTSLQGP